MTANAPARTTTSETMRAHVLVADADQAVRDSLRRQLETDGARVSVAADGATAARLIGSGDVDVALLDVALRGPAGIDLCRRIRIGHPERVDRRVPVSMPVILLSAHGGESDRVAALEAGADDVVVKPLYPREVALRVRAVLRRAPLPVASRTDLRTADLTVSAASRSVTVRGRAVSLTNREFDLLLFFVTHTDTVFTREELLAKVWQWQFGDLSTVTVHVKRLRAKLGEHHRLQTVWGRGYLWAAGEDERAVHERIG